MEFEEDYYEEPYYEEPPWIPKRRDAPGAFPLEIRQLPVEAAGDDKFMKEVDALGVMVSSNEFPEDLYQLIKRELVDIYKKWLCDLCGQRPEYAILKTMENIGFYDPASRQVVVPDPNVVEANSRMDTIDVAKKTLNYVIHLLQEHRLKTVGSTDLGSGRRASSSAGEETKDVSEYEGQAVNAVDSILTKIVLLAHNIYKVLDSATIMMMNMTMLMENAYPNNWFSVNNLTGCDFQRFMYISKPIAMEDSTKFDRHTRLVIFLLDKFRERKYRKKSTSDYLYHQIFFVREDGSRVCTHAYGPVKENIEQLVYGMVRKEYRGDLWSTLLHTGILKDVVQYIRKCVDDEVPDVNEMPRMWSFEDGIYCAETDTFAYYEDVRETFPVLATGYSTYKFMEKHLFAPVYFIENEDATPRRRTGAVDMLECGPLMTDLYSTNSPRPSPIVGAGGRGPMQSPQRVQDTLGTVVMVRVGVCV